MKPFSASFLQVDLLQCWAGLGLAGSGATHKIRGGGPTLEQILGLSQQPALPGDLKA